jgi:hypothetical protein
MTDIRATVEALRVRHGDVITSWIMQRAATELCVQAFAALREQLLAAIEVLSLDPITQKREANDFDAWLAARTERAHREYMERTSRLPMSARRTYSADEIAKFYGISHGGID